MKRFVIYLLLFCLGLSFSLGGRMLFFANDRANSAGIPALAGDGGPSISQALVRNRGSSNEETSSSTVESNVDTTESMVQLKIEPFAMVLLDLFPQAQAQGKLPPGLVELLGLTEDQVSNYYSALEFGRTHIAELEEQNAHLSLTDEGQPCVDVAAIGSEVRGVREQLMELMRQGIGDKADLLIPIVKRQDDIFETGENPARYVLDHQMEDKKVMFTLRRLVKYPDATSYTPDRGFSFYGDDLPEISERYGFVTDKLTPEIMSNH